MYANKVNENFKVGQINGFYKDKNDLVYYLNDVFGLSYDDEWTVKRYLNGFKIKTNNTLFDIFKLLGLNDSVLDKKIKILSTNEFKLVLLAFLLMKNYNVYIFDYFEVGLSYKTKKMFINLLRKLKSEGKTIIVVTNNIGFLYEVSDTIMMVENRKLIYNGPKNDLFKKKIKDEPEIIKFIRKANKRGASLLYTTDRKELIKDIYRSLKWDIWQVYNMMVHYFMDFKD